MRNAIFFIVTIVSLALASSIASAYSHTTFSLSDAITFREDVKGENRGFTLTRSTDVPRLTSAGYYDWSYRPNVVYPTADSYRIPDRVALEAFRTFSQDSRDQNKLELERERNRYFRYSYFSYYPRYSYSYPSYFGYGYYSSYYPRYYGSGYY